MRVDALRLNPASLKATRVCVRWHKTQARTTSTQLWARVLATQDDKQEQQLDCAEQSFNYPGVNQMKTMKIFIKNA